MFYMVKNLQKIFPTHKRPYERDIDNAIFSLSANDTEDIKRSRLKQHLRHFFEIRDPISKRIVVPLFEYFEFDDIARGILAKYRILPYGWRTDIESMGLGAGSSIPPGLFNFNETEDTTEKRDYGAIEGSYFADEENMKNNTEKNNKIVSQKMSNYGKHKFLTKYLAKNKIRYLSEKTVFWNDITNVKVYSPDPPNMSQIDKVIYEFINKQRRLHLTLQSFVRSYVNEALAVSQGHLGEDARQMFGMSEADVRLCFKDNFEDVIVAQEKFVTMLEPLVICKNAKLRREHLSLERAGVLCKLFIKCQRLITNGFKNYNISYTKMVETLTQRRKTAEDAQVQRKVHGIQSKHLDFLQMWEEIHSTKSSLVKKKLATILYLPVQVVPQYKIFFERILKTLLKTHGPNYPHQDLCKQAMRVAGNISVELDQNLRKAKQNMN